VAVVDADVHVVDVVTADVRVAVAVVAHGVEGAGAGQSNGLE
jgi:hypothetical protein